MSSSVEQIKTKLSIVDVLSSYLKLEKAGQNYKAACPFHNEKTPSFFISPSRNSYYCFGCGAKGDIFSFVEQFEGTDFKGALKSLAQRAGVELEPYRGENRAERSEKDRLYELMEMACRFYESEFSKNTEALEYIKTRGLTVETMKSFRIGFAPNDWRMLTDAMRKAGFSDKEIVAGGLAKHPDDKPNGEIYDRFRDRVMFPLFDTNGRVIAFSGRILHQKEGDIGAKYINSPETPIFKKGSTLYGLDKAKFDIRKRDQAILVEGQLDLVLSHQAGFTNTVASSGTALTDSLVADEDKGLLSGLGQVHGLTNNLVVAFDADKAGMKAAGRAEKIGLSLGMNVKVAKLPAGLDPADTILKNGADTWKKIISGAEHIISFYLSVLSDHSELSEHTRMRAIRDKILPYVAAMPSAVERAHFIREIHQRSGISEDALLEDVSRIIQKAEPIARAVPASMPSPIEDARTSRILDRIWGIIYKEESTDMPTIDASLVRGRLGDIIGIEGITLGDALSQEKKNERIFEVELLYTKPEKLVQDASELLDNLEEEILTRRLEDTMRKISEAERAGATDTVIVLLKESQTITSRLNTIKSSRHAK